jgi:TRAP-type C4-dicarboxylate transport system substrate-binding protein
VNVTVYLSGELLKSRELIPGLEAGTADIIMHTVSYTTGAWPVMICQELPFFWKDGDQFHEQASAGGGIRKVVDKQLEEKHGIKQIAWATLLQQPFYTLEPVRSPADLKGKKIRTAGVGQGWGLEALGAAAVGLVSAEMYEALSRGTIDGVVTQPATIEARKLYEVLKYIIDVPYVGESLAIYMRLDTFNALSKDAQDVIMEVGRQYEENLYSWVNAKHEDYKVTNAKAGMEIITLSPQEKQAFVDATKGTWAKFSEAAGADVAENIIKLAGW